MADEDQTTDPLLEILAKVRSMSARLTALEQKVEAEQKLTNRKLDNIILEMATFKARQQDMDSRLEQLENAPTGNTR